MKILVIDSLFSNFGGGQIIAYNTYRILKQKGHNVYFWGMNKKPYFEPDYEYSEYFTKFYGGKKDYIKNPLKYHYNKQAQKDLTKFISKINPDIIHIHSFWGITASIFSCLKNIPTVMTIHDASLVCPCATLMFKDKEFCKNLYCQKGHYYNCLLNKCNQGRFEPSLRKTILAYTNYKLLKNIDKFITPSDALQKLVVKGNIGIDEKQIITINNFLSENDFLHFQPSYENKGYFLYVGRLSKEKGVHYLLRALKDLPNNIELHIVGTGKEEENLINYVNENNLSNVKFLGFKNQEEIKEEYQNCIATILPCNWFEIFGLTNIESFINGKPVIASNIGGIPEIVEHNKTGLLFEPANVEQLKECILKYWNNKDLVIEHGKNAYAKAKIRYTEERYFNELINLYQNILNEKQK